MKIRRVKHSASIAVVVTVAMCSMSSPLERVAVGAPDKGKPNILIIMTDDQRASPTMHLLPRTREIFEKNGVRFPRAYATTPVCCPSRASIMTGQYAHNSGVKTNFHAPSVVQENTMQHYLDAAGYKTALFGKYLNHWPIEDPPPHFDRFVMGKGYSGEPLNFDGEVRTVTGYIPNVLGREAIGALREFDQQDSKPWMMMLHPFNPHAPSLPAPRDRGVSLPGWVGNPATKEVDLSDKPPYFYEGDPSGRSARPRVDLARRHHRTLLGVDRIVSRIYEELARLRERRNTLAFFLSDNGFLWGEHDLISKGFPYPPSIRIPMYMRWPKGVEEGTTDGRLAANIDLLPTVLDAADLDADHTIDGRSLLDRSWQRDRLLFEFYANASWKIQPWASTLSEEVQYTEYYDDNGVTAFREYYDLPEDRWRLSNALGDDDLTNDPSPFEQAQLAQQLAIDRQCAGADCP